MRKTTYLPIKVVVKGSLVIINSSDSINISSEYEIFKKEWREGWGDRAPRSQSFDICKGKKTVRHIRNDYLLVAAKHNHIELLNFITSLKEIDEETFFNVFLNFCAYGHTESCKKFIDTKPFLIFISVIIN